MAKMTWQETALDDEQIAEYTRIGITEPRVAFDLYVANFQPLNSYAMKANRWAFIENGKFSESLNSGEISVEQLNIDYNAAVSAASLSQSKKFSALAVKSDQSSTQTRGDQP